MANEEAPGWRVNADGEKQWWDGERWGPRLSDVQPASEEEESHAADKRTDHPVDTDPVKVPVVPPQPKSCLPGCLGTLVVLVLIGVSFSMCSNSPENKERRDRENASVYAEIACKDQVKARLKAPSTADFTNVTASGSGSAYKVTGAVDAENSFGAKMRNTFSCDVEIDGDRTITSNVVIE